MKSSEFEELSFDKYEYSVFDFETTGTSALQDRVIEIGIVKIQNGKITDTFKSFINPGRPVPYFITTLTGITNEDVRDAPYFDELYSKIVEFIGDSVLVAHNLQFDYSFLKHECARAELMLPKNDAVCTLKIARRLYQDLPSKSLGNVARHLKILHRKVHTGLGDATATAKIFLKMIPQLKEDHSVETISDLITFQNSVPAGKVFRVIKKKLLDEYARFPAEPGIYFFKNQKDEIVYVGKAKSLKDRIRNYFMSNAIRKSKAIVRKASDVGFHKTNTELTALLTEAELIKLHDPSMNKMLKSYPRSYFIKLAVSDKFTRPEVVPTLEFDGNNYFGPYPNRETAAAIKEIIDRAFQLRECADREFKKKRKCYLADIERCFAPCIEMQIQELYNEEIIRVSEFLCGHNQSAIDRLLFRMKELSANKKYEEAAEIRDLVQMILNQLKKASILAEPVNSAHVLIEVFGPVKNDYILLIEGKMIFREYFIEQQIDFDSALEDYYEGAIQIFKMLDNRDLERLKISLSWLVKNRTGIRVYYLDKYSTRAELESAMTQK